MQHFRYLVLRANITSKRPILVVFPQCISYCKHVVSHVRPLVVLTLTVTCWRQRRRHAIATAKLFVGLFQYLKCYCCIRIDARALALLINCRFPLAIMLLAFFFLTCHCCCLSTCWCQQQSVKKLLLSRSLQLLLLIKTNSNEILQKRNFQYQMLNVSDVVAG